MIDGDKADKKKVKNKQIDKEKSDKKIKLALQATVFAQYLKYNTFYAFKHRFL